MKYLLIVFVFLCTVRAGAQVKNPDNLTHLVNNTLMYQVLNDFDRTIPLVLYTPGFFLIGSLHHNSNPFFSESDNGENMAGKSRADTYQKEIQDVINTSFISYIPVDSTMSVRVVHDRKLLFELSFQRRNDSVFFIQTDAEKKKNKAVTVVDGKTIAVSYADQEQGITYRSQLYGDSIRISEYYDNLAQPTSKTEMRYSRGLPDVVSYYTRRSDSYDLKSADHYYYSIQGRPVLMQGIDPKGRINDSTVYYYDGDKLILTQKYNGAAVKQSYTYVYNRAGILSGKTVNLSGRIYSVDYSYANGSIASIEMDEKAKKIIRRFVFKNNIQRKLAGIEMSTINKESLIEDPKNRWVFDYNSKGNINSVKMMDDKGVITKEITFAYDFFGNP